LAHQPVQRNTRICGTHKRRLKKTGREKGGGDGAVKKSKKAVNGGPQAEFQREARVKDELGVIGGKLRLSLRVPEIADF